MTGTPELLPGTGPLNGCRVLELGTTGAGPFCARLLADFGAEVVKVEDKEGDPIRWMGKSFAGKSLYAASILRNKKLVSIDLRHPVGQQLIQQLVQKFDIVVENFRPGTLERWNLGYEDLRKWRPDLVMVRISGFGQSGPYRDRPGYGVICEAMSGLRHITGDPATPPGRVAIPLTDYITAVYSAFATSMALLVRDKSGQGQVIDAALYECALSFMEPHIPAFEKTGWVATRVGSRLPDATPNNLYTTKDNEFIHITAITNRLFTRLTRAMGQPQLAEDPRFLSQVLRTKYEDELDDLIARWAGSLPLEEIEKRLHQAEVPASRIYSMSDIFADPHVRARGMLVEAPDDDLGTITVAGVVPKLSATPGKIRWAGRRIGQDTREVLRTDAALRDSEIDALEREGVVYSDPRGNVRDLRREKK